MGTPTSAHEKWLSQSRVGHRARWKGTAQAGPTGLGQGTLVLPLVAFEAAVASYVLSPHSVRLNF